LVLLKLETSLQKISLNDGVFALIGNADDRLIDVEEQGFGPGLQMKYFLMHRDSERGAGFQKFSNKRRER